MMPAKFAYWACEGHAGARGDCTCAHVTLIRLITARMENLFLVQFMVHGISSRRGVAEPHRSLQAALLTDDRCSSLEY